MQQRGEAVILVITVCYVRLHISREKRFSFSLEEANSHIVNCFCKAMGQGSDDCFQLTAGEKLGSSDL